MRWIVLGLTTTALLAGCSAWRVDKAARVASGYISHTLCSGHFVSGFSADQMFEETVRHKRGLSTVHALLGYRVDDEYREVHAVAMIPSQQLVLVRLGHSEVNPDLFFSTDRLLGEVIAALHHAH